MTSTIEINDSKNGILSVELQDLLNEIGAKGETLNWALFYLYATGDLGDDKSMGDFEDEISDSKNGLLISWEELKSLSLKFDQIYDTLIVGNLDKEAIKKCDNDEELYSKFDVVLDLFDGAYWRVHSKYKGILKRMLGKFTDTKVLD